MGEKNLGVYSDVYGYTIRNRVLEFLLENQDLDVAIGDVAKEIEISKPKAYEVFNEFINKGFVIETRIIGKTQLYIINKDNKKVKLFLNDFKECLKLVIEEHTESKSTKSYSTKGPGMVYTGHI